MGGNGGFYIGRYEQGEGNVCVQGVTPYTNITRDNAKTQAEALYKGNTYVVSELISGYAWDTALNFICQTNTRGYNLAKTTSSQYGNIGTRRMNKSGEYSQDKYSNIFDFLGNCHEWCTEYSTSKRPDLGNKTYPHVARGGYYNGRGDSGDSRVGVLLNAKSAYYGFRLQLYIK